MKRPSKPRSGADSGDVASPAATEQTNKIPDPKALSRAQKTLGPNPPKSTFSKNFEKMLKSLSRKGDKP
jgi:hypothetical protein